MRVIVRDKKNKEVVAFETDHPRFIANLEHIIVDGQTYHIDKYEVDAIDDIEPLLFLTVRKVILSNS